MRFILVFKLIAFICFGSFILLSCSSHRERKVLVFFQSANNQSPAGIQVIQEVGKEKNFSVDTTSQPASFTEDNLKNYSTVVFLNTPGELLDIRQQTDFERYVQAGGGYVGIKPAIHVKYNWPWYENLIGGDTETEIQNPEYQDTPAQLTNIQENEPEKEDGIISWHRNISGGSAFFIAGEKVSDALSSTKEKELVAEGIDYTIGDNQINYDLATSQRVPEDNRFVKHTLVPGPLDEPTELTVLPNGKVVFIQRKGEVKMYYPDEEKVKTIAKLDVHTKFEDGLLGIAKDPDYYHNNWIYLYYSPVGEEPVQHLSRFLLLNDSLIMSSEKLILKVPVQRQECCHTGGSIAFGPDGNLYLSTGDDTNPFKSDGYAPIDERPGHAPFDAQGSSGNTNDLRGKILRISVHDDATYSIPDGNLFPKDGSTGRPEIYVMGLRNPYRISVDQKTGWLYWGDVGPDAREDSERGPRGYDAVKQAKEAGNYGWPYFRGNRPYRDYNFATGEIGDYFNPEAPVNDSPNNTGAKELPPLKKGFVWYPYDESPEFPIVGTGGRTAMAGPVFHYDMYGHAEKRFPKYYDGKLFMYEWMRNWIIAATTDEKGNLVRLEPFLDSLQFNKIIDMEMAQDGSIYILEYGSDWFAVNENASLSRIEYAEGNRAPIAKLNADQTVGAAPFTVNFSSEGTFDYDKDDELKYEWFFTGDNANSTEPNPQFTFDEPGIYEVKMRAYDKEGDSDTEDITIQVGNDRPKIDIALASNSTFYWNNEPIDYNITVVDKEDGSTVNGDIDPAAVNFTFDYVTGSADEDLGHQSSVNGLSLIENSGCKACHAFDKTSVGPAYNEVAKKYEKNKETTDKLVNKILKGGGGVWGDRVMPAQAVTQEEAEIMVSYILSLDEKGEALPLKGSFVADKADGEGTYVLNVQYTDKGGEIVGPLAAQEKIELKYPRVQAEETTNKNNAEQRSPAGTSYAYMGDMKDGSYIAFDSIDLKNVGSITLRVAATAPGYTISMKADEADGKTIATGNIPNTQDVTNWKEITIPIENAPSGKHDLFFVISASGDIPDSESASIDWIYFNKAEGKSKKVAMK